MHDILEIATNQDVRLQCIKTCVNNNTNIKQLTQILLLRLGRGREYCDQFVCLSVCGSVCMCMSVRGHISGTAGPIFTKSFVQVPCGHGSVVFVMYICGFMDDVTFGHSGPYGDAWKAEPLTYYL